MRTEKELDFLEKKIPKLAESATKSAYLKALSQGIAVTEIVDGKLVTTFPDGTRKIIKEAPPMIRVDDE